MAYVASLIAAAAIYIIYVAKNTSLSSFLNKRAPWYILLTLLLAAFTIRETKLLMSIPWLLQLDNTILFFSDNGGPIYSTINYVVILASLFCIGLLRSLQTSTPNKKPEDIKVLHESDNPFLLVFPKLKLKKAKKK